MCFYSVRFNLKGQLVTCVFRLCMMTNVRNVFNILKNSSRSETVW